MWLHLVLIWSIFWVGGALDAEPVDAATNLVLQDCSRPHVIAHRGASGYLPEHTLQAYRLAIDLGVDYIEPDLVITKDGHLICRHDPDLSETTDVASRPEFRHRIRNVTLDSVELEADGSAKRVRFTGYFSFDFTLAEIKSLRAKQRLHQRSSTYDGLFQIPTFEEVVNMVREAEASLDRPIGIYAEIKEPHFFKMHGFDIEAKVVESLGEQGFLSRPTHSLPPHAEAPQPIIVQCFDVETLQSLSRRVPSIPLVQLLLSPTENDTSTMAHHLGRDAHFGDMSLRAIAGYASGIGPQKTVFMSMLPEGARAIVDEAHNLGLGVHPWTFRREESFVDTAFRDDSEHELRFFYECLNVDALFVEFPDQANAVIQQMMEDDMVEGVASLQAVSIALGGGDQARGPVSPLGLIAPGVSTASDEEESKRTCLALRKLRSCSLEPAARTAPRWLRRKKA